MRGILIDPGCAPEIRKLPNTAQGLNAFLGGEVQIYRFGNVFAALVYTHQAQQAMPNRHYIDRWYYGRLCIVGWRNNRMTDLPPTWPRSFAAAGRMWRCRYDDRKCHPGCF